MERSFPGSKLYDFPICLEAALKKSLFPVQRVAIIVASQEASKSFEKERKNLENVKKKKMYPFGTCKLTRAMDRTQTYC